MAALQLLGIAGYSASLRLALHHHKRTLHPVQLIFLGLNKINKSTIQVLNISITFIFFIIAYISFAHTEELLYTQLGRSLLILISLLWLFRAVQQVVFYELKHKASAGLTVCRNDILTP
jgi:hypothetical protein